MSKKIQLITIISVAIIFFLSGYAVSFLVNKNGIAPAENNSFQAGWDAAKKRLIDSGFISSLGMNAEIKTLNGEIKEINGNKITLKIQPIEPLTDESLDTRIIVVDSTTKIYSMTMKDLKEYQAEVDAYNKKIKTDPKAVSPYPFIKTEVSISSLKTGQLINVIADKDIKEVKEFNAVEISTNNAV
ncbi:MAG: hypothetical protein WC461_03070 [Candidatus Paceibacterota bacterium]